MCTHAGVSHLWLFRSVCLSFLDPPNGAEVVPYCDAERYTPCSSFSTSVTIGDHRELIDNALAGFTRSEGSWTIDVQYKPAESCAIVKVLLDTGPIDIPRSYHLAFARAGGQIGDSGRFTHKMNNPGSSLKVMSSSCFMPGEVPIPKGVRPTDSSGTAQPNDLDDLLDRLARTEQLATPSLDEQLKELATQERHKQQAARKQSRRAALDPEARPEQPWGSANQRESLQEALSLLRRRAEQERLRREAREQAATDAMMTGLTLGILGGVFEVLGDDGSSDSDALEMLILTEEQSPRRTVSSRSCRRPGGGSCAIQ